MYLSLDRKQKHHFSHSIFCVSLCFIGVTLSSGCATRGYNSRTASSQEGSLPSLAGTYKLNVVVGSEDEPSTCYGNIGLPTSKPNGGLADKGLLTIQSVNSGNEFKFSFMSVPGGQINEVLSVGDTKITGTSLSRKVSVDSNGDLNVEIKGGSIQTFTFVNISWKISKTPQGNLLIENRDKSIGFFPHSSGYKCTFTVAE